MKEEKGKPIELWAVYRAYYNAGELFPPFQTLGFFVELKKGDVDLPEERIKKEFRKAVLEKHGKTPNFKKAIYVKYFFKEIPAEEFAKLLTQQEEEKQRFVEHIKKLQTYK